MILVRTGSCTLIATFVFSLSLCRISVRIFMDWLVASSVMVSAQSPQTTPTKEANIAVVHNVDLFTDIPKSSPFPLNGLSSSALHTVMTLINVGPLPIMTCLTVLDSLKEHGRSEL